jgi:hypothetical protein
MFDAGVDVCGRLEMVNVAGRQTVNLGHGFELDTAGQMGRGNNSGATTEQEANGRAEV